MYSTIEAAKLIGISKNTLLKWITEGFVSDVKRDWRGWRIWNKKNINETLKFKKNYHSQPKPRKRRRTILEETFYRSFTENIQQHGKALSNYGRLK
jgi:DNA-binding transcriptional MerR regulator